MKYLESEINDKKHNLNSFFYKKFFKKKKLMMDYVQNINNLKSILKGIKQKNKQVSVFAIFFR